VPGGYHLLVAATMRQCVDACLMTSYCLAVDYDIRSRDCHVHGSASYCSDVISQTDVVHYKRVPCAATAAGKLRILVECPLTKHYHDRIQKALTDIAAVAVLKDCTMCNSLLSATCCFLHFGFYL